MNILTDTGKAFNKIQYSFLIKALNEGGLERNFVHLIKGIYENPKLTYSMA